MGRKSRGISVTETTINNGQKVWRVNIPPSMVGHRIRKFFNDEGAALSWADDFARRLKKHGTQGIALGGTTTLDAVRRFFATRGKLLHGPHLKNFQFWLRHFAEFAGSAYIQEITASDIERFWSSQMWAANTRRQAWVYLRGFFGWCERHDMIGRNPALRADVPPAERPPRAILAPEQMLSLIQAAGVEMRACLCLGGFAGLRTSEILRSKINVEKNEIHVEDGKTGGRYVEILPVFRRFWPGYHYPPSQKTFYRHIAILVDMLGLKKWPDNCLRHSFASYHLAMWQDAGKTAYQLGHTSPQMVYKAYARAVKREDAERWWALNVANGPAQGNP